MLNTMKAARAGKSTCSCINTTINLKILKYQDLNNIAHNNQKGGNNSDTINRGTKMIGILFILICVFDNFPHIYNVFWLCSTPCVLSSPTYHCQPPKPHLHQSPFPGSWLLVWFYDTLNSLRTTCVPLEPGGVINESTAAGKDSPLPASTPDCQGLTLVQNRCIHSSCEIRIAIAAPVQETAFCSPAPYHLDLQPFYPLLQRFLSLSRVV